MILKAHTFAVGAVVIVVTGAGVVAALVAAAAVVHAGVGVTRLNVENWWGENHSVDCMFVL